MLDLLGFIRIVLQNLFLDLALRRDHRIDVSAENIANRIERLHVGRITHRDGQDVVVLRDRHYPVVLHHVRTERIDHPLRNIEAGNIDQLHSVLLRKHREQLLLLNHAVFLQNIDGVRQSAGRLRFLAGFCHLLRRHHAVFFEQTEHVFGISGQTSTPGNCVPTRFR